jgi:hypothetical protein
LLSLVAVPVAAEIVLGFDYSVGDEFAPRILDSLGDGHRSEVIYETRVYRRNKGLAKLFGDRLIGETTTVYDARRDELNEWYVVTVDGMHEHTFVREEDLVRFFLTLSDRRIVLDEIGEGEIYLLCRSQIEPIKLVPPLTLMTFFIPELRITTPWKNTPYRRFEP